MSNFVRQNLCKFAQIVQNLSNFKKSGVFSKFQSEIAIFFDVFRPPKKVDKKHVFPSGSFYFTPHFRTKNSAEIFVQFLYKFCTNCTKFDKLQKMCVFTSEQGICTIFFTNFQILCMVENHSCTTPKTDGKFRFVTLFYQIFRRRKFVQILSDNFAQNLSKNVGLGQNLSDLQKMCVFLYEGAIWAFFVDFLHFVKKVCQKWYYRLELSILHTIFVEFFCRTFLHKFCRKLLFAKNFRRTFCPNLTFCTNFVRICQILTNFDKFVWFLYNNTNSFLTAHWDFHKKSGIFVKLCVTHFSTICQKLLMSIDLSVIHNFFHVLHMTTHVMQMLRKHWFTVNMKTVCYTLCIAYTKNVFYFFVVTSHRIHVQHVYKTCESHHFPGGFTWTKHNVYI